MTDVEFNSLKPREKWDRWKDQDGQWICENCGVILMDGPQRASPFWGTSVHCGDCDCILTKRTGGGMSDPFGWVLIPDDC